MSRSQNNQFRRFKEMKERRELGIDKDINKAMKITSNESIYKYTGKYDGCYGMGKHR